MSKIAREITKKASTVALAASLFLQPVCATAVEMTNARENNTSAVEKTTDTTEKVEALDETEEFIKELSVETEVGKETAADQTETAAKAKEEVKEADEDVVKFADANFEKYIRKQYNIPDTRKVTKKDVEKITILRIDKDNNIKNVDGIEYFTKLGSLEVNDDIDISAVANCTSLTTVHLNDDTQDVSLDIFKKLTNLKYLHVSKSSTSTNLNALENCKNMISLQVLNAPKISDISAIRNMTNIEHIGVTGNESQKSVLNDISAIEGLYKLKIVNFEYTSISNEDITIFAKLPGLRNIYIGSCEITDVSGLSSLIYEEKNAVLWLDGNKISDPTPILQGKFLAVRASKQEVTLPEIVTIGGDVTVKLANSEYITDVQIDEKEGKYNPETKEITFYNVTADKEVKYKVRMQNNLDAEVYFPIVPLNGKSGYDYIATVTQPLRIGAPVEEVTDKTENSGQVVADKTVSTNTSVVKETAKTGNAGVLGTLSLAFISMAGAVKTRKRK